MLRHAREGLGLSPAEAARALRVGRSTYYRFESAGGPPWVLLALAGLGVTERRRSVVSMTMLLGVNLDTDPARRPDGTYAPFVPPLEEIKAVRARIASERRWHVR